MTGELNRAERRRIERAHAKARQEPDDGLDLAIQIGYSADGSPIEKILAGTTAKGKLIATFGDRLIDEPVIHTFAPEQIPALIAKLDAIGLAETPDVHELTEWIVTHPDAHAVIASATARREEPTP